MIKVGFKMTQAHADRHDVAFQLKTEHASCDRVSPGTIADVVAQAAGQTVRMVQEEGKVLSLLP
jgi:hypothetical protein